MRDLGLLDTEAEEEFDRYTRLATELLGLPVSLVSLVDADRQFFKSQQGLTGSFAAAGQTPLSHSFCQHAVATHKPLIVADAREHPLVADNLAVRDLGVIAYAGIPLVLSSGVRTGSRVAQRRDAALGCSLGHGYLFAKPLPAHEIALATARAPGTA